MKKIVVWPLWALLALVLLSLVTLPVSLQAQLVGSAIILGAMIVMKQFRPDGVWRLVALAFGTTIVLRYVYWRTTSTIPPVNQIENFIPGFLLYLAEMYSVGMLALSLFVVAKPMSPREPVMPAGKRLPTVDVFIPTYNEDAEMLANTIAAAQAMNYPKDLVTIWLLDDGGTEQKRGSDKILEAAAAERRHAELRGICDDFGIRYLTRARNEHAKAGNLNNALQHSHGELVAVFDADHAPARDFLERTVGYFAEDPKLFLVQTPHFFLNPDPVENNLGTFEKMPSENEMFYGIIQRGLDKWNGSFFCGSAALLRREALEQTGGFSGVSITEDCETAVDLHASGWNSVYVDKPLIAGLQPATFSSFIGQRSRWAQGMMQILLLRSPIFKRGLSMPQRLCYMSSTLFWLFPFPRMIFLVAPLCYLFLDLQIFTASGSEFLVYTLAYMVANMLMQNYLYGSFRWPWISELYEYMQSVHLLPAVISVMFNPRKPTFKVTAKDESVSEDRLSEHARPFFLIFGILLAGLAVSIYRIYTEPWKADVTLVVGGWNLLNLIMAGCALGVVSERGQRRVFTHRVKVSRRCECRISDQVYPGTIEDVSVHGARVVIYGVNAAELSRGMAGEISFEPLTEGVGGSLPILIRAVGDDGDTVALGCRYAPETAEHRRLIADLIFANSAQWSEFQISRRRNPGVLLGTLGFLVTSVRATGRGLSYALAAAFRGSGAREEIKGGKKA
ncbi:UDP-forming cellulose synthase catalytic subunit [Rhodobacteraceae bacterium DSL-40]|uniref:UDP-forming cellulose synthase catalytic subunit n=1 Tax=Amaricoccus sp. B4 TaxID=3368557 RepID=UPI000DAC1A7C